MDINLTQQEVEEIRAILLDVSNRLDFYIDKFDRSEGLNENWPESRMDAILANPMNACIYKLGRIFEIFDLSEIRA